MSSSCRVLAERTPDEQLKTWASSSRSSSLSACPRYGIQSLRSGVVNRTWFNSCQSDSGVTTLMKPADLVTNRAWAWP